ncbi:MAG: RHS repeat-associated core domain-containing protein, partial [Chitinophagales bacterium]
MLNGIENATSYTYEDITKDFLLKEKSSRSNNFETEEITTYDNYIAAGSYLANKPRTIQTLYKKIGYPDKSTKLEYTYNPSTGAIETERTDIWKSTESVKTNEYDLVGNIIKTRLQAIRDPTLTPKVLETKYDNSYRFVEKKFNVLGQLENTTLYDARTGVPTQSTDINGVTTKFYYDNWNKLTQTTIPSVNVTSDIKFAWLGSATATHFYQKTTTVTGKAGVSSFHDILGRETEMFTFGRFGKSMRKNIDYDEEGKTISETNLYYTNESPHTTSYIYDEYGRPLSITNPFGTSLIAYDDDFNGVGHNKVITTNPQGQVKETYIDQSGKTYKVIDIHGNEILSEFNSLGQLLSTSVDGKTKVVYNYDQEDRLKSQYDISNGLTSYEYDEWGQLKSETNARKQKESYTYDIYGRKTSVTNPEGVTTYKYVPFGSNGRNQIQQIFTLGTNKKENIRENFVYDSKGRMTKHTKKIGGTALSVSLTYDPKFDNITKKTYSSGVSLSYVYDQYQNLSRIMSGSGKLIYDLRDANSFDQPTEFALGNNLTTFQTYNFNFPESTITEKPSNVYNPFTGQQIFAAPDILLKYSVHIDPPSGNVLSRSYSNSYSQFSSLGGPFGLGSNVAVTINTMDETFAYDASDRLSSSQLTITNWSPFSYYNVNNNPAINISYDNLGNIDNKDDIGSYKYDKNGKNQLTSISNAGSAVSRMLQTLLYTSFEQPQEICEKSEWLRYAYGSNQQRYRGIWYESQSMRPSKIKRVRYYFGDMEVNVEPSSLNSGSYKADYIHYVTGIDGKIVAIIKNSEDNFDINTVCLETPETDLIQASPNRPIRSLEEYYYIYTDHLGSILAVTDDNGHLLHEANFDAWGRNRIPYNGAYTSGVSASLPWLYRGYTGHEHLFDFDIINMNGRLYDPAVGRFFSTDQYIADGENSLCYNRYAYCLNNPLKYTDPDGEHPLVVAIAIGAAMGAASYTLGVLVNNGRFDFGLFARSVVVGAISGAVSCGIGSWASGTLTSEA